MRSLLPGLIALVLAAPVHAEVPIVDGEELQFGLGGYLRVLSALQNIDYDTLGLFPEETALGMSVVRMEWGLSIGWDVSVDIHQRLFWRLSSEDSLLLGAGLGLGSTAAPERFLDARETLTEGDRYSLEHDIDRFVIRLYLDAMDLYIGRQAIRWGHTTLFPVADLWGQFSPFELDTTEKRGVDAARVIISIDDETELELLIGEKADPALDSEVSSIATGARLNLFMNFGDLTFATAKIWNEVLFFAGVTADLDDLGLRFDAVVPWHSDEEVVRLPRLTLGLDYFATDLILTTEVHFNGLGVSDSSEYLTQFSHESIGRGESYLLGRFYAGTALLYRLTELVSATVSVLANLQDPSAIAALGLDYSVSEDADITVGGFLPIGASPVISLTPEINSEFGTYARQLYVQVAAYW
jgi:hypothetical protein